jgi:hypothetical protein
LLSTSTRVSTTVLATAMAMPKTAPSVQLQPKPRITIMLNPVATALWTIVPGTAIRFTASSSLKWKCSPTPNISRITPMCAICSARWRSAT